jgi:hypothetical protein
MLCLTLDTIMVQTNMVQTKLELKLPHPGYDGNALSRLLKIMQEITTISKFLITVNQKFVKNRLWFSIINYYCSHSLLSEVRDALHSIL